MVYRVYVEKRKGFDNEARSLLNEIRNVLQIRSVEAVRMLNRYDAEGLDEELFAASVRNVFSEPMVDDVCYALPETDCAVFAVEYLPGQFDQRADSAAQCISLLSRRERPTVRTARVYMLQGSVSAEELAAIKKYVINPVEAREASLDTFDTLQTPFDIPTEVETLIGFRSLDEAGLAALVGSMGLAMDTDDLRMCREYFVSEERDPTVTEIRMIDTYWSDHCRHTTFLTVIDSVKFEDELLQQPKYRELFNLPAQVGGKDTSYEDVLKKFGEVLGTETANALGRMTKKLKSKPAVLMEALKVIFAETAKEIQKSKKANGYRRGGDPFLLDNWICQTIEDRRIKLERVTDLVTLKKELANYRKTVR